ncbi:ABC transporter permease [Lichenifustis flavocetrariae]|uniref:ABC transporter permease n=1 Tax=Lichenifustis flavocetrariae TaxID=2949735 RepID=A0AA41Z1B3_9HYPH|nr:ABC transporter permease [Lichenifustis flavocetrariae]MCW6507437.1 ABC transporter permease [Lichenifustis flavocetrariae]
MPDSRQILALPVVLLLLVGAILPLTILVVISFWSVDFDAFELVPGFGLASWREILGNPTYPYLIGKAVLTGGVTTSLTALAGYPLALSLLRLPKRWKSVALVVLLTPLYTGEIVRIYAWRLVLGTDGLVNSLLMGLHLVDAPLKFLLFSPFTTALALFYDELPFMTLALWIALERLDMRLVEAARDLGARPLPAFIRVTLPLTSTGLCAGALAVFALSAGDMQTPNFLGGPSGATALASIDNFFGTAFDWPTASALALTLLLTLIVAAALLAAGILRLGGRPARVAR